MSDVKQSLWMELNQILSRQWKTIDQMILKILADTDPEDLHDFRVASRRSRSALILIKPAIEKTQRKQLLTIYRYFTRSTNRLRDLDVYAENIQNYFDLLPPAMHSELKQYQQRLKRRRHREAVKVHQLMRSTEFQTAAQQLRMQVDGSEELTKGKKAHEPADAYAAKKILKQYQNVVDEGSRLIQKPSDILLHQLRISCKKLRYLMEFFRGNFHADSVTPLVKQLKALQTLLGDYNDLTVQMSTIRQDLIRSRSTDRHRYAMLGGLQAVLFVRRKEMYSEFESVFDTFISKSIRRSYQKVFVF